MKITLNDVTNIDALSVINDNFDKIEQELQNKVLYRNNPDGEPNPIEKDIDVNGKNLLNVGEVFSSYGRWATINEVEEIKEEVLVNASQVSTDKTLTLGYRNSAEGFLNSTSALYDNFDDRYLGQKASDPSVDNDGGLLLTGALYFRTSGTPIMRVYNGTTWQDVGSITTTTTNLIDPTLYSSQAEAEAGANNTKVITPLRAKNAIDAQVKGGFTSTGAIVLPGNAASALEAVPKQQLDASPGRLLAVRVFTTANTGQTYTPTAGTTSVIVQAVGGGGAGGGTVATGAAEVAVAGPGTSGSYGASRYTSGFSGAALTIGLGGASVVGANGGGGGTTSFGALLSCPGGVGGGAGGNASAGGSYANSAASAPAAASGANIYSIQGVPGVPTIWNASGSFVNGIGAGSPLGSGGINGSAPSGYGGGGGGKVVGAGAGATPGNAGASGAIIVWEYA